MKWPRAILTDSGGFQIFSLPNARSLGEDGAEFTSYADGRKLLLTPERSIAMQRAIGSDIMMALDQCIDSTSPHAHARAAMELTHRWARRSLAARGDSPQALFAIVQGACFADLRRESAGALTELRRVRRLRDRRARGRRDPCPARGHHRARRPGSCPRTSRAT